MMAAKPIAPEPDWEALKTEVYGSFSPGSPIKLWEDLAGRQDQAQRLRNIVLSAGEHALVYGERGDTTLFQETLRPMTGRAMKAAASRRLWQGE